MLKSPLQNGRTGGQSPAMETTGMPPRITMASLLKQILPGLLPLFIFVIADEIWGTMVGLYVAVGFGVIELAFTWVKDRRLDGFILGDTALLVAMGLVSILLENDIFFKLKPALLELILCVILGVSAYSSRNIVMMMSRRYMKNMPMEFGDEQMKLLRRPIRALFWLLAAHIALIIYSAYFMSREAWAFVSGGLFYIVVGVYFTGQIAYQRWMIRKRRKSFTPAAEWERDFHLGDRQ